MSWLSAVLLLCTCTDETIAPPCVELAPPACCWDLGAYTICFKQNCPAVYPTPESYLTQMMHLLDLKPEV